MYQCCSKQLPDGNLMPACSAQSRSVRCTRDGCLLSTTMLKRIVEEFSATSCPRLGSVCRQVGPNEVEANLHWHLFTHIWELAVTIATKGDHNGAHDFAQFNVGIANFLLVDFAAATCKACSPNNYSAKTTESMCWRKNRGCSLKMVLDIKSVDVSVWVNIIEPEHSNNLQFCSGMSVKSGWVACWQPQGHNHNTSIWNIICSKI